MKKTLAIAALTVLLLTGCGYTPPPPDNTAGQDARYSGSDFTEVKVKLSDGRTVLCLKYIGTGGPSCDWEAAK